jgi:hypothetical protein
MILQVELSLCLVMNMLLLSLIVVGHVLQLVVLGGRQGMLVQKEIVSIYKEPISWYCY